jgi:glycoprotein endo-alpha-1,2-mannosidase
MSVCPSVHAAFYLWYGTPQIDGKWMHWDHPTLPHWSHQVRERYPPAGTPFEPPDRPHSPFYPERGLYSSQDNATLRAQFSELAAAGVTTVMLSWWGQRSLPIQRDSQGVNTDLLIPAVLDAAADSGMRVSWHLEPYGGRTPQSVLGDLRYLHVEYGTHPAVWRHGEDNRPLVFLCTPPLFELGTLAQCVALLSLC